MAGGDSYHTGRDADEESSGLLARARRQDGCVRAGRVRVRIPRELGFCHGVERAVARALEARERFPDRRILLTGPIVHNPLVNARLAGAGIETLRGEGPDRLRSVRPEDVVLVPAFGLPLDDLAGLRERGVTLVDTTCSSVVRVWRSVERLARDGYTVLIHGKAEHEETRATCSRTGGGPFLVLRDVAEAEVVAAAIEGALDARALRARLGTALSPEFDPERDLRRVGCAHQTTMLARESRAVERVVREALRRRHGPDGLEARFRGLDSVCRETQDRQDALREVLAEAPDLALVLGGYDSSNTGHLARIARETCPTYHVDRAACLESPEVVRHRVPDGDAEIRTRGWLPAGEVLVAVTAGASTPDDEIESLLGRLRALATGAA